MKESEYSKNIFGSGVNDEDCGGNAVQNKITAKAAHLASCFHKGDAIKLGKWIVSFIPKLLD
ncbi:MULTISPECIES: hypothetical protein [Peribacillus]|uniref:hypothetical protein n=1 Tax=Peribacillus TaxID=2675229 RepID=UPI001070EDD1|nr:hypothetical protein [Peribacillus frigoritolerans]MEC0343216.1 hypothetical protein [Peribacillus castrilensis]TFH61146.1 hypothetical protein E4J71_12540 [Peribacillus frigoritolerans]